MARAFKPVVLTANDLTEGDAIWWTGSGWSRRVADALLLQDESAALASERALAAEADRIVGLYRVEVDLTEAGPWPTLRREAIRAERRPTFAYLPIDAVQEAA